MKTVVNTLPALFGGDAFDRMASELFENSLVSERYSYPTDIVQVFDENGQVTGYEILVALAGIDKSFVDVSTDNDVLIISVKKDEKEEKNRAYIQKGISHRAMESRFGFHGIDKTKIKATFVDGMLKVELPLAEEVKPASIKIG